MLASFATLESTFTDANKEEVGTKWDMCIVYVLRTVVRRAGYLFNAAETKIKTLYQVWSIFPCAKPTKINVLARFVCGQRLLLRV